MTTKTMLVFISRSFNLVVSSLLSLFVVRLILKFIGSDYNGLNAVLTQVLSVFVLVESSFFLASRVALYKPFIKNDFPKVNVILSTTSDMFKKIGVYAFISGFLFSFIFAIILKTDIDFISIIVVFTLTLISLIFNTTIVNKYNLLFQVSQTEYISNFIQTVFSIVSQLVAMVVIIYTQNIILLRLQYTLFAIISGLVTRNVARRRFEHINYNSEVDYSLIKGTKDVLVSSTVGLVYRSSAIFFISSYGGTLLVSVYAVYNAVLSVMERVIYSVIESPQNALGQIISKGDSEESYYFFKQYEHITIIVVTILISTTFSLIFSFVRLYTLGVHDINYHNFAIGFLLVLNSSIMFIHIPSGNSINLSGHFWITRKIQISALVILLVFMSIGGSFFGLYGILFANTLTGLFLLVFEVYYSRKHVFYVSAKDFVLKLVPNLLVGTFLGVSGYLISKGVQSWTYFLILGFLFTTFNCVIVVSLNRVLFPNDMMIVIDRFSRIFKKILTEAYHKQ